MEKAVGLFSHYRLKNNCHVAGQLPEGIGCRTLRVSRAGMNTPISRQASPPAVTGIPSFEVTAISTIVFARKVVSIVSLSVTW